VPIAGLVQATDGNLYGVNSDEGTGMNHGAIFKISPKSPYNYTVLYDYSGTEGYSPEVTLLQHTSGILYGDNYSGGAAAYGTFFSFNLGLKPFVNLLPTSGKVGKSIGILGQGFNGTTAVFFQWDSRNLYGSFQHLSDGQSS
jgi:hypothetical protein